MKQLARLQPDPYDSELEVIAHVLSYFEVASKRIIDDIPMVFENSFAFTFAQELETQLQDKLGLIGTGGLEIGARYAANESEIQKRREDLTRQLAILKKAEEMVYKFHLLN
jgi:Dynamin GTPase effector domain